jgi:HSP20 family protein
MSVLRKWERPTISTRLSDLFDFDRLFDDNWLESIRYARVPATNIVETDEEFQIEMAAPGLTKKDFHIDVKNGVLEIRVEKEAEKKDERKNYRRREYSYYSFNRSFTLPSAVNADSIQAKYVDGILRLMVPKKAEVKKQAAKEISVA